MAGRSGRLTNLRQRWTDRAAQRMFERLLAQPAAYTSTPSTVVATCLAMVVVGGYLAILGLLVWATLNATGFVWVIVALGWACVIVSRPRPFRLPPDVLVLQPEEFPGLHALTAEIARGVGVTSPRVLGVELSFNAYVAPLGLITNKDAMVLGLPMMSLGSWSERIGVVGHELGHLRGRDTTRSRLIGAAYEILDGIHYVLAPEPGQRNRWAPGGVARESYGAGFFEDLTRWVQGLLALPFFAATLLLVRVTLASDQHREYLADRRAAEVVGSHAVAASLLWDIEGIRTAAAAAARRQENPFEALLGRKSMTSEQAAARLATLERKVHRSDSTHPPDHLRIKLVSAGALPASSTMPVENITLAAEAELHTLRERYQREFRDRLIHGRRA